MTSSSYDRVRNDLKQTPHVWLITGVAGFIGSNLLEALLKLDQRVTLLWVLFFVSAVITALAKSEVFWLFVGSGQLRSWKVVAMTPS